MVHLVTVVHCAFCFFSAGYWAVGQIEFSNEYPSVARSYQVQQLKEKLAEVEATHI